MSIMKMDLTWTEINKVLPELDRALLTGPPGVGKSHVALNSAARTQKVFSVTLTEDSTVADLIGFHTLVDGDKGSVIEWHDGPVLSAWREGGLLVVNELHRAIGAVQNIMLAVLDDQNLAQLTLPSGETVRPAKGFRCICTANEAMEVLDPALQDRLCVEIFITKPSAAALKALGDTKLSKACENSYARNPVQFPYRSWQRYAQLRDKLKNNDLAGKLVFGPNWSEVKTATAVAK